MRKIILLILSIVITLCAKDADLLQEALEGDIDAQRQLAKRYEDNGDFHKAYFWYKNIASDNQALRLEKEKKILHFDAQMQQDILKSLDNNSSKSALAQILSADFGLYPHRSNYLMPITRDFKDKDDRLMYDTHFQFSFKIPLTQDAFNLDETIHLAYTQQSWWQTTQDSAPFRESNYQPEIFMTMPLQLQSAPSLKLLQLGLRHNSNGQGGLQSRSLNYLYARVSAQFKHLFVHLQNWYRIPEARKKDPSDHRGDDNPDYIDHYGHGSVELQYLYQKQLFSLLYRYNLKDASKGAYTLSWSFGLEYLLGNDHVYGFIKYFDGYGESLIDYNRRVRRLGIGIQFSR